MCQCIKTPECQSGMRPEFRRVSRAGVWVFFWVGCGDELGLVRVGR